MGSSVKYRPSQPHLRSGAEGGRVTTLVVGMVFEGGAVVAADTRELHARGSVPVDGVGKLAVASWGLVSGGGRTDVLARVKESLVNRPNPSPAEIHAVVSLALDAAGHCGASTEMVLSFEPAGPARPAAVPDQQLDDAAVARPSRVVLYRDDGALQPPASVRFALLPPRDVDRTVALGWAHEVHLTLLSGVGPPTRGRAVQAVLACFSLLGACSREVSPDLDLGVHEEGRKFHVDRLWW
jgi:hypothetical protein